MSSALRLLTKQPLSCIITPCYQTIGPAQSSVGTLVGPAHWQPTVNEPPISGPASAAVGAAHKQPTVKKGQLVRGLRQQLSDGCEVESEVKRQIPAFSPRPSSSSGRRPVGELGCPENRLGVSCKALEPSPRPPTSLGPGLEAVVNLSSILVSAT